MKSLREQYQLIAAIALVIGVALITVAESPSFHWTRILGATAISVGAAGVGIYVGLSNPGRYAAAKARLQAVRTPISIVILALLFLPALAGLVAGLIGLFDGPDGTGWVVAVGALTLAFMLAATASAFVIGLRAVAGDTKPADRGEQ